MSSLTDPAENGAFDLEAELLAELKRKHLVATGGQPAQRPTRKTASPLSTNETLIPDMGDEPRASNAIELADPKAKAKPNPKWRRLSMKTKGGDAEQDGTTQQSNGHFDHDEDGKDDTPKNPLQKKPSAKTQRGKQKDTDDGDKGCARVNGWTVEINGWTVKKYMPLIEGQCAYYKYINPDGEMYNSRKQAAEAGFAGMD